MFKYSQALLRGMMLFAMLGGSNAFADVQALLTDAGDALPATSSMEPTFAARTRYVRINTSFLFDKTGTPLKADVLPNIALDLFPNAKFTGVVSTVEQTSDTTTWAGTLQGVPQSHFYMVAVGGVFIVHVASTQDVFEVSSAGDNLYRVIQINQSELRDEPLGEMAKPGPVLKKKSLGTNADSGSTIDVMVVYTTAARAAEGSTAAMKARVALAMKETNQAYLNSGVNPRLRLVHTEEIPYTESGNIDTDLNRLVSPNDGYMDNVHTLRNTYGADMVSLVVENGGIYCGVATGIMATAATAFDVTVRPGCMTGYYSFGHEFGHLQGARHDIYVDPTNTPYPYGHGYTYPPGRWRTVMAYNDACAAQGVNCTRLQYFSNPTKSYSGKPMGVTGVSEVYKVLNNTAYTVANFRSAVIGSDFSSNFNGSAAGWTAVKGSWAVNSAYVYTSGLAGYGSSIKHNGTYGDITYQAQVYRAGCVGCANRLIIRGNAAKLASTYSWAPSYNFQYANDGTFSVYKLSSTGVSTALKSWTTSSAIAKNGWNTLKVVAVGPTLRFYINNTLVWTGSDAGYKTGSVGIGMYRDTSSTGNRFYVNSASLQTTPTAADILSKPDVAPGVEVPGGDFNHSP